VTRLGISFQGIAATDLKGWWWNVLKQCVPARIIWDPWFQKWIVPETPCPVAVIMHRPKPILKFWYHVKDRDGSMQGHCVFGKIHFGDQGSQKIRTGTHRFRTSHHPTDSNSLKVAWLDCFAYCRLCHQPLYVQTKFYFSKLYRWTHVHRSKF